MSADRQPVISVRELNATAMRAMAGEADEYAARFELISVKVNQPFLDKQDEFEARN